MNLLETMISAATLFATPIIIAALGTLYSERSGIVNIGIEGIMLFGAFIGAVTLISLEGVQGAVWIALIAGACGGILISLIHALAVITFKADHIISGTAINMFIPGITIFMCQILYNQQRTKTFNDAFKTVTIPGISKIPILGAFFTNVYSTFFLALFLVVITYLVLYKTKFGLRLRACGEFPQAASSMGINVYKYRYIGVMLSGLLGGAAGAIMVLTASTQFTAVSVHGFGFIALATLIFGRWSAWGILGAGLFFGFSNVFSIYSTSFTITQNLPTQFFDALPYVITIIALIIIALTGSGQGPKAAGEVFDEGKR